MTHFLRTGIVVTLRILHVYHFPDFTSAARMRDSNPRVGCIGTVRLGTCLIRGKSHVGSVHFNRGMKTAVDNP
jgi:hypothetical protein